MEVFKNPESMTKLGYVSFLMTFVALGMFVYALAAASAVFAVALSLILASCVCVMVVAFRAGARRRAQSNDSGIAIDGANILAQPMSREAIDRYLLLYRGARTDNEAQAGLPAVAEHPWPAVAGRRAA